MASLLYTNWTMSTAANAHKLNQTLVDKLITDGQLTAPAVEAAFRNVLRHHFVPDQPMEDVYQDRAIGTKVMDEDTVSSSSQPTMMAIMLEQLALEPGHRVLEIGAGTGFNAALMAHIVGETGHIVTVDIDQDIVDDAKAHLATAGVLGVEAVCADGGYGWLPGAPYDRIILTVGADDIAPAWWAQLKPGGLLVLPLALGVSQLVIAFEKVDDAKANQQLISRSIRHCRFIRLRGAFASEQSNQILDSNGECSITATLEAAAHFDVGSIYQWLHESHLAQTTGVFVTPQEATEGLGNWLLLREPVAALIIAAGHAAEQGLVPALTTYQIFHSVQTVGLCSRQGMALLYLATQDAPTSAVGHRCPVMIARYGSCDELAEKLSDLVHEWEQIGRPQVTNMHVTAVPKRDDSQAIAHGTEPGSLVISKEWSDFYLQMRV